MDVVQQRKSLGLAVMVLELLQWKGAVSGLDRVVVAAQDLLQALMPQVGSIAVPHREADGPDGENEEGAGREPADADAAGRSSLAGYAAQLVLSGIEARLKEGGHVAGAAAAGGLPPALLRALRPELAVRAAQEAPDSAVRNAALSLVSVLAGLMPEAVLGYVLQVRGLHTCVGNAGARACCPAFILVAHIYFR